jgi:hypothetical protein
MLQEQIEYLRDNPNHYWFKRKLYGWGWTPATWQGWASVLSYLLVIVALTFTVHADTSDSKAVFNFLLPVLVLTGLLVAACYIKGERPAWQWGKRKK